VDGPLCLLLLPARLEDFILRETARDLLRAPNVIALEPPRAPYGVFGRVPLGLARHLGRRQARRLKLMLPVRVVVMFHPLQLFLAEGLLERNPGAELWYSRWDRYEVARDAPPAMRRRLEDYHARAAEQATFVFAVSGALAAIERAEGRSAQVVVPAHDDFPAPEAAVVAVTLGHLGYRVDWALVRALAERMPDLVLLMIGTRHDDELAGDADFQACLELPNIVWLGHQPDEAAARLVACAHVGIVPFAREPFNDASLPQRIVKHARLGRRTLVPDLEGVRTLERAITVCHDFDEWEAALRAAQPDPALRDWALAQTAVAQNAPLWERLEALGVVAWAD
jgi:hypothetical protein